MDARPYPKVYKEWIDSDRGTGKTHLLRMIALVESTFHPVIVFVANTATASEFIRGMPEEVLSGHQFRKNSFTLEYQNGIKVLPVSTCRLETTYGLVRECVLIDDVQYMNNEMLRFHSQRAKKMLVCGNRGY